MNFDPFRCDFGVCGAPGVAQGSPRDPRGRPEPPPGRYLLIWEAFWAPFEVSFGSILVSVSPPKFDYFLIDFLMPYCLQNCALLRPFWGHFRGRNFNKIVLDFGGGSELDFGSPRASPEAKTIENAWRVV